MTCPPASSAERKPQSNTAGPDFYQLWPRTSEAGLQLAKDAPIKPAPRSQPLLDYHLTEALSLRAAMIRDRQAAINRRDMQAVNEIEADLRDVVMVAMMGRVR
jgi:hypothetical protein